MKRIRISCFLPSLLLLLAGCSQAPPPKKEPPKPPEPVTGQSAIFQTYQVARTWAGDAKLLRLESGNIPEAPSGAGKYGFWRATYVSESKRQRREFTWAAADSEGGIIKGVRPGMESGYFPNPRQFAIAIQDVKIDTPQALEAAMAEVNKDAAMKKVLADNRDLPIHFLLEWNAPDVKPAWRVIFGPSISQSKFSVFIDAYTGKFVKKLR
ncbi:MAG: hypothetical protein KatS3mg004_1624 [Bryobacteraceae bacterium]|nr:MAG: hypothetical protein KatS3mg004_1624 [Bryobacteraceae bacterium]